MHGVPAMEDGGWERGHGEVGDRLASTRPRESDEGEPAPECG